MAGQGEDVWGSAQCTFICPTWDHNGLSPCKGFQSVWLSNPLFRKHCTLYSETPLPSTPLHLEVLQFKHYFIEYRGMAQDKVMWKINDKTWFSNLNFPDLFSPSPSPKKTVMSSCNCNFLMNCISWRSPFSPSAMVSGGLMVRSLIAFSLFIRFTQQNLLFSHFEFLGARC